MVFNVPEARDCRLTDTRTVTQFVLGDNGPGRTLVAADGANLTTSADIWSAVGYNDTARLEVETGGEVNFGQHMWVGLIDGGVGTVDLNGGTINVGAMTGLGWDGGVGFVNVNDGMLNMTGFDPARSIGDGSVLNVENGTVSIVGNLVNQVLVLAEAGKITAFGGSDSLMVVFDADANRTVITAEQTNSVGGVVIPGKISLDRNYPNPFDRATTIGFKLRERANVQLTVYNAAGIRVAELLDRRMTSGTHQVDWDAAGMPVGVYVVRLRADGSVLARQITLVR